MIPILDYNLTHNFLYRTAKQIVHPVVWLVHLEHLEELLM